jgi:SAM-dependent methyltransferase
MPDFDPRQVFSSRVADYIKYRIGYPTEVIDTLVKGCGLTPTWRVADIGSGTGLLARLFLDFGCAVSGVEPNDEMRLAGERILADYPRFTSLLGSAEATGLPDASTNLVCAGMAFHWFDTHRTREEFRRILTSEGWIALVWNRMLTAPNPFMQAYTGLVLEYSPGWTETQRRDQPGSSVDLSAFFSNYQRAAFPIKQVLDWNGLCGRTLSIAHTPAPDDPARTSLLTRLRNLFEQYQNNGHVSIAYETELYYGHGNGRKWSHDENHMDGESTTA